MDEISLKPIGQIRNNIKEKMRCGWANVESVIEIKPDFTSSLDGLDDFSHVIVLFWMHQSPGEIPAKVRPQGRADMPLTGVFATRAPHRPNSIGMSVVRLLGRIGDSLRVLGLDAIDETPVLDLKPYLPKDAVPEASHPDWISRLDFT